MARTVEVPKKPKLITYRYTASTSRGERVRGAVKTTSEIAAERLIIEKGLNPEIVEVAPSAFSLEEALPTLFKVKPRDVIVFSRQLATLLRSGISLLPSLEILQQQVAASRGFRNILGSILNEIRSGGSFSTAISKHPRAFNDIYHRTIAVGEETGNLDAVLNQMADYLERQTVMAQKIRKALTYPILVISAGVVVVILLLTVVMPKLLGLFTAMGVALPLPTKILIFLTTFINDNKFYLVIAGALLGALVLWLLKQPTGRRFFDRVRLRAPVIGPPILMAELGRFARSMSVMIKAGLKLQEIMEIMPESTSNKVFQNALNQIKERLLLGEGLSEPMSRIDVFPPLLIQMVAVGEESNTLDFTLKVVADFYETEAEERTTAMVGLIGPLSTIGIALLVGFIALSVIMPMYTLTGAFGK